MSLVATEPQPALAWQFESSNVDYITGLSPNLSTAGTYAAPSGGTITTVGGNRIHTFTTTGTDSITFLVPTTIQLLVVAGGGGGGGCGTNNQTGGGGGAGEYYYNATYSVVPGTYTINVGAGGTRGVGSGTRGGTPTNGENSNIFGIDCNGGGYGGANGGLDNGGAGGSGGGGSRSATGGASNKTAAGSGNAGGNSAGVNGSTAGGGGGGGAGGAGDDASGGNSNSAAGGAGLSTSISGTSLQYASGGSGGARGGIVDGSAGTNGRGNGGGGGGGQAVTNGGNGGSGVVVIAYNSALYPAPTYVTGKYNQAINFNNQTAGTGANSFVSYDVSSFNLTSNSSTLSLWLNPSYTYPLSAGSNPYYIHLQGTTYYSFQTENTLRSNISLHTGGSPSLVAGRAAQSGVWNHYCGVFSNVGTTGASNTASYFYLNGALIGSGNTLIQSFTSLYLASQLGIQNGAWCSIDDLRVYNTALTAAQVQSVYNQQGVPGRAVALVAPISTIAPGSTAIYSTNRVNPSYSGAIVNVERASDGTVSDFYVDNRGNFTQISGTSLTSWLGGAQANVLIWYDQSGAGRNAIKDNTTIYGRAPQLVVDPAGSGKYVIYFPNQNSTATNYYGFRISAQTTASMMCRFYVKSTKTGLDPQWESLLCTNSDNQGVRFNSLAMNTGDGNDFLNPGGFAIYDGTLKNTSPYLTATRDSWHTMMASRVSGSMSMQYIGQCNATGAIIARSLYGYMTDMVTFPTASSQTMYSAYFATPTITMTGAPLFSQLSAAAASSAVGAFSLRAINGVTAKAVQIRRSSDSVTQDFWADAQGNLLTAPVTGQLLQNWLGGSTATLLTWYDQSGLGNHATQTTAANQPVIKRATKGPGYSCLFSTSSSIQISNQTLIDGTPYTWSISSRRTSSGGTSAYILGTVTPALTDTRLFLGYYSTNAQLIISQYSDDKTQSVPAYSAGESISYDFHMHNQNHTANIWSYRSGASYTGAIGTFTNFLTAGSGNKYSIGSGGWQGEIYEVLVFTQSLYDLDNTGGLITQLYQNQLSAYGT